MKLSNLSSSPKIISRRYSPASLRIYFPASKSVFEYVIYDNYDMDRLLRKFRSIGRLVAQLKTLGYKQENVTSEYVRTTDSGSQPK